MPPESRMGVHGTAHPADVDAPGIGGRPHLPADVAHPNASGVRLAVDRASDAPYVDSAGIGARPQPAVGWGLDFQMHRNALEQGLIAYGHADGVSVLLDGRVRFQFADAALHIAAVEPVPPALRIPRM